MSDSYCLCIDLVTVSDAVLFGGGGGGKRGLKCNECMGIWPNSNLHYSVTNRHISKVLKKH